MLATQSRVAASRPVLLRYWTSPDHIRVEWPSGTTVGRLDGDRIRWEYDPPPLKYEWIVSSCAASAGEWTVDGATYEGNESYAEMCHAAESTCCNCGMRCSTPIELSEGGQCALCFVAQMGVA